MLAITSPYPQLFDLDGSPLDGGKVYFGQAGTNPLVASNRIPVYWDEAGTQPIAQPVATSNGYFYRSGTPAMVFADQRYSIAIYNKRGQLVAYAIDAAKGGVLDYSLSLSEDDGLGYIGGFDSYSDLRAYRGKQKRVSVTGILGAAQPSGIAGEFTRDDTDSTSPDNGGTIIVDVLGRRWKRLYTGYIRPEWFDTSYGAMVSRAAIVAALAAGPIVLSAGLTYLVDTGPVPVPSGARICGEEGSVLRCTMSGLGPEVGIFTNTGGTNIRLRGITVVNVPTLSADYDRFLFKGLSVSDVRVERSDCTNAAVAMFGTTAQSSPFALDATIYAAVVTDESDPGFNQSRDVHVSDYKVRGLASDRTLVRAAAYFHYCKRWSATNGDVQDAAFPVMFWGGDSAQTQGAVGSERKCSRGKIVNVNSLRTVAGPWGSNGDDITATSCDGQDGFDVGLDFEGCTNSHSVNCTMSGFANGNFTNFFYGKNVTHTGWGSKQGSASAPHIRIYNNSNDGSNNRQIGFYDGTAETVGIIGVLDDAAGPASELSLCRNKLINTRIDLSAPNKENLRVEDNDLLFTLSAGGQMMAISVTGCSGSNAKVRRNTVLSLVSQPSSSAAIYAVNTDANFAPVFDIHRNTTEGFPADLFMGCTSANAGIPGVFVVEDNQFGAGVIGYVNPTRVLSKWRRNRNGAAQNFPNGPDTTRFWSVGTEAETDAPAIGKPAKWRVITSGFPATWAKEADLTSA